MRRIATFGGLVFAGIFAAMVLLPVQRTSTGDWVHERAAMRAIQTIHTAEVQFNSQYGRYAVSLQELGPPASGAASDAAADLIDAHLASGTTLGYEFRLTGNSSGYVVNAGPVSYGVDGSRTFYSDQTMVIRVNNAPQPATARSKEFGRR